MRKAIIILILAILLGMLCVTPALADFGDYTSVTLTIVAGGSGKEPYTVGKKVTVTAIADCIAEAWADYGYPQNHAKAFTESYFTITSPDGSVIYSDYGSNSDDVSSGDTTLGVEADASQVYEWESKIKLTQAGDYKVRVTGYAWAAQDGRYADTWSTDYDTETFIITAIPRGAKK